MSSRFTFSACAASDTDSAEMTGPGLVKLNRSILWKYGCPGSFKYCKMTQHYRKTHHKRKPSQVERQTVKSHSACSRTIPISGHVTELFFLVQCLFALSSGLTEVLASLALAMLLVPRLIIGILAGTMIRIFHLFLGVVNEFMWSVWLGKYTSPTTHHQGSVFLNTAMTVLCNARPFFAVDTHYCAECSKAHASAMNDKKKYCHIKCEACNREYVKCLISECTSSHFPMETFKSKSIRNYMNYHIGRAHNVKLEKHEDYSERVVVVTDTEGVVQLEPGKGASSDGNCPQDEEQADTGCVEFDCTEASMDMEGVVQLEPGKGASSDGIRPQEVLDVEAGDDVSDPRDSMNDDVDSEDEEHGAVPDCSQNYVPEIIEINMENTIQEENEDCDSIEYHQFMTHQGMNLNPHFDEHALPIEGLLKPAKPIIVDTQLDYGFHDFDFLDFRTDDAKKFVRKNSKAEAYSQTQLYFYQKYVVRSMKSVDTGGYQGLVHRANVENKEDSSGLSDIDETQLAYMMQKILLGIKGDLNDVFLQFQSKMRDMLNTTCSSKTNFPRTRTDARRFFIDGAHSIMKNFPVQEVFEVNNHACVSLKETIMLAAGHRGGFNFAWDGRTGMEGSMDGLNGTRAVKDLVTDIEAAMRKAMENEEPDQQAEKIKRTSKGYVYFWSDSFLRCFVKQKDNSVWILTVTISPPWAEINKGTYTHVLAMGKSSDDHTPVIDHYMREARELQRGFQCYFGDTNDIRDVAFGLLLHSADRPERQGLGHTRKEGHYGKISNYAHSVTSLFPACVECYKDHLLLILGERSTQRSCQKCQNWTLNPGVQDSPVPKDYPEAKECNVSVKPPEGREPGLKKIGPIKLSSEFLIQACSFAYEMRREGKWLKAELTDYLRTCNVNDVIVQRIDDLVDQDKSNNTRTDIREILPAIWLEYDCFDRHRLPDLPMHGVSHGMICDMIDFFHGVLAKWKRMSTFDKFANETINDIAAFQLSWCKIKRLPKAAWVSENTNAFMRLFSYLYGMYFLNHPVDEEKKMHFVNMSRMMNASQACISVLMARGDIEGSEVEQYMKLLMSTAHYLHKEFGSIGKKDDPEKDDSKGDTNQKTRKKTRKRKRNSTDLVDQLSYDDVVTLLKEIEPSPKRKFTVKKEQLRKISTKTLTSKLKQMNEKLSGNKNALWLRLFSKILDRSLEAEFQQCNSQKEGATSTDSNNALDQSLEAEVETCNMETTGMDDSDKLVDANTFESNNETYIWNKGAWLSFCVNIKSQWDYLGNAILIYEAREENSIRSPKAILYGMQKNQEYREWKLRLLHKLNGFDTLMNAFPEILTSDPRTRYKGYHVFDSCEDIKRRHRDGKALSCFTLDGDTDIVCVAFHGGYNFDDNGYDIVHYITFEYNAGGIMDDKVSGVHFCSFKEGSVQTIKKEDLNVRIGDYALMLPLTVAGNRFAKQFTLVYSDWEVLRTDIQEKNKGRPCVDKLLFNELLSSRRM